MRGTTMRSRRTGTVFAIILTGGAALVAPAATTAAPSGGEVVIAVTTEPSTLDAQLVNDRNSRVVTGNLYQGLLGRDATGQVVPVLALSYENTAETTWTFELRPDVTFHDGTTFDADDVVFSVERMISEEFDTQRTS